MADRREEAIQEYKRWLQRYTWIWFCTLKVTSGGINSTGRALSMFYRWIGDVRRAEGGDKFRWFRVLETGADGNNPHFHLLVGGIKKRERIWQERWNDLGGDAVVTPYDADQEGILYMLKGMDKNGDLDCDYSLPAKKNAQDAVDDEVLQETKSAPAVVLVNGIDGKTTPAELKKPFKRFGRVLEIAVVGSWDEEDRTMLSATITMQDAEAAAAAARELDGLKFWGVAIEVSLASK
jgi:hypothetical protein